MNFKKIFSVFVCALAMLPSAAFAFSPDPIVSAWMPVSWDVAEARQSFTDNIELFDEISPFQYNLLDDGTIGLYANAEDPTLVRDAHAAGVRVIPTITNNFSAAKVHAFVHDEKKRATLITDIMERIEEHDYDGIDIDFEGIDASDKDDFTTFIRELADALHAENKIFSIAIQSRTAKTTGSTALSQDWDAIGKVVDRFRIMTYDFHWQSSNAGAISPIAWIEDVAAYAEAHVPHDKIIMGIPFYGYNWPCAPGNWNDCDRAISVRYTQTEDWLEQYGVPLGWDAENQEPYFTYILPEPYGTSPTTERIVYFQNAASIHSKLLAFADNNVNGIAIWRLGFEDPGNFASIQLSMRGNIQPDFSDAGKAHWAYTFIQPLRNRGIVQGIREQFFPERTISRAEALKMAVGATKVPLLTYEQPSLADLASTDWAYRYAQTALTRGWIQLPENGRIRPQDTLSRGEAVTILARATNLDLTAPDGNFPDVSTDHTLGIYIDAAKHAKWVSGYNDGTFKPDQAVTRAEFAKLLTNASP